MVDEERKKKQQSEGDLFPAKKLEEDTRTKKVFRT